MSKAEAEGMNNLQIAEVFTKIAALTELKGEGNFVVRAYQRAAHTIERLPVELEQYVAEGNNLRELSGIGEAIAKKIRELLETGRLEFYEELKAEFPEGLLQLLDVPGIGPKTAMLVCTELGVSAVEQLEAAIEDGRVAGLPRLGEKAAENILRHIRSLRTKEQRTPLGRALPVAEVVIEHLRQRGPGISRLEPAGSLRRYEETVGDIDAFVALPEVAEVLGHGSTKGSVVTKVGLQVDLRVVADEEYGSLLQYFTGSKQHNVILREYANRMGLSLNEYGITDTKTGEVEKYTDEESFYARLGLPCFPPELRQGTTELDVARRGVLPNLVEVSDINGDLHVHTAWSDGRDAMEAMLAAAAERGYQYVAITDHSSGRGIANGLTRERLLRQIELVRSLDGRFGTMKLLTGSEVDIRADGSLDYAEELLRELDVVVASVHSAMGQDRETMTERIIQAMRNPYVTVIGHPTTRLVGQRPPIEVDMEALFQAAAETGTAMEINASPDRMDLRDVHVLRAKEVGVPLMINTDAHWTEHFANMRFGVAVARRGWCEAIHVVNTRPLDQFLAFIRRKRTQPEATVVH